MTRVALLARDLDIDSSRLREFARDYGYEWPSSLVILNEKEVEFVRTVAAPALRQLAVPSKIPSAPPENNPFPAGISCTAFDSPIQDRHGSQSIAAINGTRLQSYIAEMDLAWIVQRTIRREESRRIYVTTCAIVTEAVLAMIREATEATRMADVSLTQKCANDLARLVEDFFAKQNLSYKVPPGIRTALSCIGAARNGFIHRRKVLESRTCANLVQYSRTLHEWIEDLSNTLSVRKA